MGTGSLKTREKRREGIISATSQNGPTSSPWLDVPLWTGKYELEVFIPSQPFFSLKMLVHSYLFFFLLIAYLIKRYCTALACVAQLVGASPHGPKGLGFDYWLGRIQEGNQSMLLSDIDVCLCVCVCVSLSLRPSPSLSKKRKLKNVLWWEFIRRDIVSAKNLFNFSAQGLPY